MKKVILLGLIVILLVSGCADQVQEEPLEEQSPEPQPRPFVPREPIELEISAEGRITEINYIFASFTYGGFIESIDFEVTNTGEESIVISADYIISDLTEEDSDSMIILQGLGAGIIPIGNIAPQETKSFTWQVPKERIRTGHEYKVVLKINDTISKKELVVIDKTQELPCRGDC